MNLEDGAAASVSAGPSAEFEEEQGVMGEILQVD
jgi:hypothetical protein